jgi:pyruvate dehydrogenase E1 component alpha subunit
VIAKHLGILQTSGIVGGCLPLAAGAAFSIKTRGTDQVSLCFFGDGALEEGAVHEAMNMSSLWKLPVIFMCENNSVPPERRKQGDYPSSTLAATQLVDVAKAMNIESLVVDGSDVRGVQSQIEKLVARARRKEGPFFVESRLTRWPGNMGTFPKLIGGLYDIAWAWSPTDGPAELRDWLAQSDPISLFARALVDEGKLARVEVEATHAEAKEEITTAERFALQSPEPTPESAMDYIRA